MDTDGKLIRLNNRFPEFYQVLRELANEEKGGAEADSAREWGIFLGCRLMMTNQAEYR